MHYKLFCLSNGDNQIGIVTLIKLMCCFKNDRHKHDPSVLGTIAIVTNGEPVQLHNPMLLMHQFEQKSLDVRLRDA